MDRTAQHDADRDLLGAILGFVAGHPDPAVGRFKVAVADWGSDWTPVPPRQLPAAGFLEPGNAAPETRPLLEAFIRHRDSRFWEQSYTKADAVVGDNMLAGYGFAEVIGKRGPFLSDRVRAGLGVWGPWIDYPAHRHAAEEVYLPLAGGAEFRLGDAPPAIYGPGTAVHVPSLLTHGFRTLEAPFAVFYIWQAGDLREKSTFEARADA